MMTSKIITGACFVKIPVLFLLILLCFGCALRKEHYGSILDLTQESSINSSQQVLDSIVGLRDKSELPTLYYIESGQSSWSPSYSTSISAAIPGLNYSNTNLSKGLSGGESLSSSMQFNDFGPAAMTRVTAMLAFLVFPLDISNQQFPNGSIYTVLRESDNHQDFLLWCKTKENRYLGVTRETQFEFFKLTRDIIYWSRHAEPNPQELESVAGQIYGFFSQYPTTEIALNEAVKKMRQSEKDFNDSQDDYVNFYKSVREIEDQFRQSKESHTILKEILAEAYKQQQMKYEILGSANGAKNTAQKNLAAQKQKIEQLIASFRQCLISIQNSDKQVSGVNIDKIIQPFRDRVDGILAQNPDIVKDVEYQMPNTAGIDAKDSVDKLYRDRFEALPDRFDTRMQQN